MTAESVREAAERETLPDDATEDDEPETGLPEPEQPETEDADPESEPAATVEPDMGKVLKQLDAEGTRHEKRLRDIMGDDFDMMQPCPLCDQPGFVFPWQEGSPVAGAKREMLATYMGDAEPALLDAKHAETCGDCDGYGEVVSGSKRPETRAIPCPTCGALGWVAKGSTAPAQQPYPVLEPVPAPQSVNANGSHEPDVWGRPHGHPHYGTPPSLVGV